MKKILLCSAAVVGVAFAAAPAMAQVDVTVGGYTKNYVGWMDQDTNTGTSTDERNFDVLRDSELHFNAEGTADNGLTYGFHSELLADGGDDADTVQESYLYLASSLGRVNIGSEDGANYLLQVAAPSADANIDGLRNYIQPVNYELTDLAGIGFGTGLDYANDATGFAEKVTYLSPNWAGFQFGVSYTPDVADDGSVDATTGFNPAHTEDTLGDAYEGALRYEGTFNNVGFALGTGYTHVGVENNATATPDTDAVNQWNVGADFDIGAFGVGAVYTQTNNIAGGDNDAETYVIGGDYTTGPFQFGASYFNQDVDAVAQTDRYTGGVVYTLTQGLTLRGSISYISSDVEDAVGGHDVDGTSVLGGVQFNF